MAFMNVVHLVFQTGTDKTKLEISGSHGVVFAGGGRVVRDFEAAEFVRDACDVGQFMKESS